MRKLDALAARRIPETSDFHFFTFEFRFHNFNSFVYKTLIKINIKIKKLRKKTIYTANASQNIAIQIHLFSQNFSN